MLGKVRLGYLYLNIYLYLLIGKDVRVVCYFPYYSEDSGCTPSNIDPKLCTHIIYVYSGLDKEELTLAPIDPTIDIDQGTII